MHAFRTFSRALLVLAALAACGDDRSAATGPSDDVLAVEDVPLAELAQTASLEGLTDEDRAAVRAALETAVRQLRSIRERFRAGEITREAALAEARAVHDTLIETLSRFLTEEQIARLLRRHDDPARPRLELSPEQREAIGDLLEAFRSFVREVRADVGAGEISAEEGRRLVREQARDLRAEVCAILTEEQRAEVRFCGSGAGR